MSILSKSDIAAQPLRKAPAWKKCGVPRRVDYTFDMRRHGSPAPKKIPHYTLSGRYPSGGALFLSGKQRPAARAMSCYDKTLQLQAGDLRVLSEEEQGQKQGQKGEDIVWHIWRIECRSGTRSGCRKGDLNSVGEALKALLVWDVVAPAVPCALLPEAFGAAWKRARRECSSIRDVFRFRARLRASLRRVPEDLPRKEILAAAKGVEMRCGCEGKGCLPVFPDFYTEESMRRLDITEEIHLKTS